MKIVVMSDLHQEIGYYPHVLNKAEGGDVLILAGDITCARFFAAHRVDADSRAQRKHMNKLLKYCEKFRKTFYVMGNHEHYRFLYNDTAKVLQAAFPQLTILEDQAELFDDVMFIGSTMWTSFDNGNPVEMLMIQQAMNDYDQIFINEGAASMRKLRPQDIWTTHQVSKMFLENQLCKTAANNQKTVVINHHAPSFQSDNRKHGDYLSYAYYNQFDQLIEDNPQVKLWVHGHTHHSTDYMIGQTRVYSNQRGYAGHEASANAFKPTILEI